MSNSNFRAIPESNTFTIPFKLEESALLDWLAKLSSHSGKEACLLTLQLIQALNKKADLSPKSRTHFLKLIAQYLKSYINHLENPCWDAGFPLAMEERVYAQMITWNYSVLGEGFFIAALTSNKKDEELLALATALYAFGQAQLHLAAIYATPDTGFWISIYQIFVLAEKKKLINTPIQTDDFPSTTIKNLFTRLLVFQTCDTNQFRPRDMRTIFEFLEKVCVDLPISPLFTGEQNLFLFDTQTDNPPLPVKKQTELASDSTRYFLPATVAKNIISLLKKGDMWSGTAKAMNTTLFRQVVKTLEQKQKRVYTRRNESRSLLGVIGFESILGFLYAVTKKLDPLSPALTQSEPSVLSHSTSLAKNDTITLSPPVDSVELNQAAESEHTIWMRQKQNLSAPSQKVSLKKIIVFDSSANGYSLYWNQSDAKAKVGDIFGIISDDKKRLEIAFIRRIAMSEDNAFRFGTEVVGFESELVFVSPLDDQNKTSWAIFIPGIELLNKPDTLIYPIGRFKVGDGLYLYHSEGKNLSVVVRDIHSTTTISHVELAYPPAKNASNKS